MRKLVPVLERKPKPGLTSIAALRAKLLIVLPEAGQPGLCPYWIEKEISKDKAYTDEQYGEAIGQLMDEKLVVEYSGLFRKS
jgi:hypothetical protein